MTHFTERLRYRLITGPDDAEFCARVSMLLDEGYELYGSPAITHDASGRAYVAQAVILPAYEAVRYRGSGAAAAKPVEPGPTEPGPEAPEARETAKAPDAPGTRGAPAEPSSPPAEAQ